eukprot:SM000142S00555  [mRNA]  locus=s142:267194:271360:- [translate_table: standard]
MTAGKVLRSGKGRAAAVAALALLVFAAFTVVFDVEYLVVSAGEAAAHAKRIFLYSRDKGVEEIEGQLHQPSITIFCAPKEYTDSPDDGSKRALLSYLRLEPPVKIVLLGSHPSLYTVAKDFPGRITVDPHIDSNFRGLPLFHSLLARALAADTDVSLLINADILLLGDVMPTIYKVANSYRNWLLTSMRWDLGMNFPFTYQAPGAPLLHQNGTVATEQDVAHFVKTNGTLHTYGGLDFWAWNNAPGVPLHDIPMPPYAYARGRYDNWIIHETVESGYREVVDATDTATNVHVEHSYEYMMTANKGAAGAEKGTNFWSANKARTWEAFLNVHLSQTSGGTFRNQLGTAFHCPWRLMSCFAPLEGNLCLIKRKRLGVCSCEASNYALKTQNDPSLMKDNRTFKCGAMSTEKLYEIEATPKKDSFPGLPHTLPHLLEQVADEDKVVILIGVTYAYRDLLINFVCRLQTLQVTNYLVVALDVDLYKFAFAQGLPVYYDKDVGDGSKTYGDCEFNSACFRSATKLKSRAVLKVLKAGFSVLWSDVDIVWFTNPLPDLMKYGPGVLATQSNEPNHTLASNGLRRINSGFYIAISDPKTIKALEAVVADASKSPLSEQPSFYDVLCGKAGELKVGSDGCTNKDGFKVVFLSSKEYPNGAVGEIWKSKNVLQECQWRGCKILHNNWIKGLDAKIDRLKLNGFWRYDMVGRMCIHPWHPFAKNVDWGDGKFVKPRETPLAVAAAEVRPATSLLTNATSEMKQTETPDKSLA